MGCHALPPYRSWVQRRSQDLPWGRAQSPWYSCTWPTCQTHRPPAVRHSTGREGDVEMASRANQKTLYSSIHLTNTYYDTLTNDVIIQNVQQTDLLHVLGYNHAHRVCTSVPWGVLAVKCCMDPLTQISPVQDGPLRLPPGLPQNSALHSLTNCGAVVQGWCHECIASPHYAEITVCQPGPLQHLNIDRKDSNTTCPVGRTNDEILGSLCCCQCRQQTQYTKHMHGAKMLLWWGMKQTVNKDRLTDSHTTLHTSSIQHTTCTQLRKDNRHWMHCITQTSQTEYFIH